MNHRLMRTRGIVLEHLALSKSTAVIRRYGGVVAFRLVRRLQQNGFGGFLMGP